MDMIEPSSDCDTLHPQGRRGKKQRWVTNGSCSKTHRPILLLAHATVAWLCYSMGVLHPATFAMGPSARKPTSTRVLISHAAEEQTSNTDFAQFQEMMNDPEKMKKMQASVNQMMQDPEKKNAIDKWMQSMTAVADSLKTDPELESVFKDLEKNGMGALDKYQDNESVMQKIRAVQTELKEDVIALTAEKELQEDLISEIFSKFDVDKDGFLNLDEFNALQTATEGTESTFDAAALEELLLAVDPDLEDREKGMPFKMYRRLYVDKMLSQTYNTDVVRDHGKIFGAREGDVPNAQVSDGVFETD
jgi:Ca2+-binding EF-hand superfamily protein